MCKRCKKGSKKGSKRGPKWGHFGDLRRPPNRGETMDFALFCLFLGVSNPEIMDFGVLAENPIFAISGNLKIETVQTFNIGI